MAYVRTVPVDDAVGDVREQYARAQATMGYVPNYTQLFSLRPDVNAAWGTLIGAIRSTLDPRRYELVTLAAARALRSSYCSLAHGKVLLDTHYAHGEVQAIATAPETAGLDTVDVALMAFAAKVARDAPGVTAADIQTLRDHGLGDPEIFDVVAAVSARCFFSTLLDALGAEPDATYGELEPGLRDVLTVGREISTQPTRTLP